MLSLKRKINKKGFALIEIIVGMGVFLLFAFGIYGGINLIYKIVYSSRLRIIETAILSEKLEVVRNLPFDQVGILNGIPSGVLPHSQTTTLNGINFILTTTVRNIDDPFDGTVTTTPQDTSPADYKLVEMSIICSNCIQKKSVLLSTRVSPPGLEGASNNGSLFIHVFDANGIDVPQANVAITYIGSTTIMINDATDNQGMLRIVDTPTGTESYHIVVSKADYSSDYTVSSTVGNPNPDKPPSTVVTQTVTEVSFAIDQLASLILNSVDSACAVIGSFDFRARGSKTVGHNPIVYKYQQDLSTNASGVYDFGTMEWDDYLLSSISATYNIAGTIPISPISLTPGSVQQSYVILSPHTSNSLLVKVKDAGTSGPLASSSVRLYKIGYDQTVTTSIGYTRQTDWSGGSGQIFFVDNDSYFADDGNIEAMVFAGDIKLKQFTGSYFNDGWIESSTFDMGPNSTYRNIVLDPISQPASTSVRIQIATSNSSTPAVWDFLGPDGTAVTYYTATSTLIHEGHNNRQYLRYKILLHTDDNNITPTFSEILLTHTNQCTPPGQAFFSGLSMGSYTLEVQREGYDSISGPIDISGNIDTEVNLSISGG
ncbi:MAG: hypothetical protein ABH832_02470 [bacterium]